MKTSIPSYGPDGHRVRSFSLEAVLRLESLSLVVVRRNRKGVVTRAHFRPADGGNPLRGTVRPGQRYSFEARGEYGHWWEFAKFVHLDDHDVDEAELDLFLREIFGAVRLSCLRTLPAPPKRRADVVCISDRRPMRESPLLAA